MPRKLVCVCLALVMCALSLSIGALAADDTALVAGETPKASFSLAEGAYVVCYEFGASDRFGASELSVLTFDTDRGDLLFEVARGADAVSGKAVASVRGASGASDESFALDGGAIAFAQGESVSFGVSATGEAMVGELRAAIELRDRDAGRSVTADAVNRDGEIAVYTSGGEAPPRDKYSLAIECPTDGLLVPGVPVEGVVAATAKAGGALGVSGEIIIAGDEEALADFAPGDRVTITADVSDERGAFAAWRTVKDSVGGSTILVKDGAAIAPYGERVTSSAIGVRGDGKGVIVSFARGAGMDAEKLASLCIELGLRDAFAVDCGETIALVDPNGEAAEAPELPDIAAEVASPLWYLKHMKVEPVGGEVKAIPIAGASDSAAEAPAEARGADAPTCAEDGYEPTSALLKQIEFDSTGEWLTLVINESDVEAWYGKIF